MIDKTFWEEVAGEWKKKDDIIVPPIWPIPPIDTEPDGPIDPDEILAEFGIDI